MSDDDFSQTVVRLLGMGRVLQIWLQAGAHVRLVARLILRLFFAEDRRINIYFAIRSPSITLDCSRYLTV